jgi:enoyl-CoA hydratase/carnithine racemase
MPTDDEVPDGYGLSYEVLDGVALIRIDRPDKLGAFTWKMIERWTEALVSAQCDDAVRAVVLTGTGRGFCTGVDPMNSPPSAAIPLIRSAC